MVDRAWQQHQCGNRSGQLLNMNLAARRSTLYLASLLLASTARVLSGGKFELAWNSVVLPEVGTVSRCLLSTDKTTYIFTPPRMWRVDVESSDKTVNIHSPEGTLITIHSTGESDGTNGEKSATSIRDLAISRFPAAKVSEDFACYTEGASGRAVDVEIKSSVGTTMSSRLALVSINGETIEFRLTCRSERFTSESMFLSSLLTSFQVAPASEKER